MMDTNDFHIYIDGRFRMAVGSLTVAQEEAENLVQDEADEGKKYSTAVIVQLHELAGHVVVGFVYHDGNEIRFASTNDFLGE